jgi:hypothetical protein
MKVKPPWTHNDFVDAFSNIARKTPVLLVHEMNELMSSTSSPI